MTASESSFKVRQAGQDWRRDQRLETCMSDFGEALRRERESRGVGLETITLVTKIGSRYLRALEEEKFDALPGGARLPARGGIRTGAGLAPGRASRDPPGNQRITQTEA